MKAYLLMDLSAARQTPAPGDLIMLVKKSTNSGSASTIDLSKELKTASDVGFFQFKVADMTTTSSVSCAAAVAGASDIVWNVFLTDAENIKSL